MMGLKYGDYADYPCDGGALQDSDDDCSWQAVYRSNRVQIPVG